MNDRLHTNSCGICVRVRCGVLRSVCVCREDISARIMRVSYNQICSRVA